MSFTHLQFPLTQCSNSNHSCSDENAEKEDIYQLGVLLLQVITGKLVTFSNELDGLKLEVCKFIGSTSPPKFKPNSIGWIKFPMLWLQLEKCLSEGPSKLRGVIDPSIRGTFADESMKTTVEFAINSLSKDSTKRPSIEDVLWNLQYSIQVQEGWASSGNLATHM